MKKAMINYIQSEKFDDIYTPDHAVKPLLKYLPVEPMKIWECCDFGGSNISKLLRKMGHTVISTDKEFNFLTGDCAFEFDMIITNCPYSLKDKFISKCYEYNKPFALLLPITALEGVARGKMYREHSIELLVLDRRVNFLQHMGLKEKGGNWFNSSWFCWKILPKQLIFEEL